MHTVQISTIEGTHQARDRLQVASPIPPLPTRAAMKSGLLGARLGLLWVHGGALLSLLSVRGEVSHLETPPLLVVFGELQSDGSFAHIVS